LFVFLENHGMLSVTGSPVWRTIRGGSTTYVERIVKGLHAVHTGTRVRSVTRTSGHIEIRDECDQVALLRSRCDSDTR
jgi:predicted NAD/FAD-binding protein